MPARQGTAPRPVPRVNAHIHLPPNFSAFESVEAAVNLAAKQGIRVLGVSNYYNYEVYGEFVSRARRKGIFPLFGTEIICMDDALRSRDQAQRPRQPRQVLPLRQGDHAFRRHDPEAARLIDLIRRNDSTRMAQVVARVSQIFRDRGLATDIDDQAVVDMIVASPRL